MIFLLLPFFSLFADLADLNQRVIWELDRIGFPEEWTEKGEMLDVAIIGAGMAGIASAYGLQRMGIHNITLYDESPSGEEGPWLTYAQMKTLRTPKDATGPCLFTPSLTFQAWYETVYGETAWDQLKKPSSQDWGNYLIWLRTILKLPVRNNCRLLEIVPLNGYFEMKFENFSAFAKKIVLATGRKGCGGYESIPEIDALHTSEIKDYSLFKDKRIIIIGAGASAFDAAGAALEAGALSIDLLYRRSELPKINKMDALAHPGMERGFYSLPDPWKFKIIQYVEENGTPPTPEAIERVKGYNHFHLHPNTSILMNGMFTYDHLILATGFRVSIENTPELRHFSSAIKLWKDVGFDSEFPYLGPHFQFQEKEPGSSPFLKHIYCFNYGAYLSFGSSSSSIDSISAGAEILSHGIAADFFHEQIDQFFNDLKTYQGEQDAGN